MSNKECVAMILAGGQGSRLAALTTKIPKPAIPFGGNYRLIDFSLSNCYNSNIDTIGVLTSRQPFKLNTQRDQYNIRTLPPSGSNGLFAYTGTANAVYENIDFIDQFAPEYVVILSGDHVYKMDYSLLLKYHKEKGAAVTISTVEVPWSEAPRFGILDTGMDGAVVEFAEKPAQPKSNLASMGVYLFSWSKLKAYLRLDESNPFSGHDFGKNIIPTMLGQGEKLYAYRFKGYWKDVGTIESLYKAHMDLLSSTPTFTLQDTKWPIYSTLTDLPFSTSLADCKRRTLISNSCFNNGMVENSILFPGAYIGKKANVKDSVIMPGAYIGHAAYVERAIVGPGASIQNGHSIRGGAAGSITVIGQNTMAAPVITTIGRSSANRIWGMNQMFGSVGRSR